MSISWKLDELINTSAERLRHISGQFWGTSDVDPGEAKKPCDEMQKLLGDQPQEGGYCYSDDIFYAVRKYGREAFSLPFFMWPPDDEVLAVGCRDDLLRIWATGKFDEVVNLAKQYYEFRELGERFAKLAGLCSRARSDGYEYTNPLRAYTCIGISEYFCDQLSQGNLDICDDVYIRNLVTVPEGNTYRDNRQRVAHDLSIAERAIFQSEILYYFGGFLFV